MPYNNAPIEPTDEITGTSNLPLARVKKIISQDDEIAQCSNNAAFAISVATVSQADYNKQSIDPNKVQEVFVRYLTEQAYTVVKSEKKPRRNIAYKDIGKVNPSTDSCIVIDRDLANAVSRIDNLEFLSDVVPKTKTYRQFREEKAREEAAAAEKANAARVVGVSNDQNSKSIDQMLQQQNQPSHAILLNGESDHDANPPPSASQSTLVERTILQNGHGHASQQRDVDMTG